MKGKTKLEDLKVTKVDVVDIGADQKANILIKKRGGEGEERESFFKRFFNAFCNSLGLESEDVRKNLENESASFDDVMNEKKIYDVRDQIWNACNSLEQSLVSILLDKECEDKQLAIARSIEQFKTFSEEASKSWIKFERAQTDREEAAEADEFEVEKMKEMIEKSCKKETEIEKENEMVLNLANMTEEEKRSALKQLQEDLNKEKAEGDNTNGTNAKNVDDQVQKAVDAAMEKVTKNFSEMMEKIMEPIKKRTEEAEQKSLEEVAKKYEILGTKVEDLVPVLKSLKGTSEEAYNGFLASMDANVEAIQKSGLFEEIGKSGGAHTGNEETEAVAKMHAKVAEIKKSMPGLSDVQAQDFVMKNDPELRALFDK